MIDVKYLSTLSSDEKNDEIKRIIDENIKNKNYQEAYEALIFMIGIYENERDYSSILDLISDYLLGEFKDNDKHTLYDYQIKAYLRLEEYNELLNVIEKKKQIKDLSDTELTNIKFYSAIAYEGLDEINQAIEALESIVDNIPKHSLVNKYLKLAILYLKNGNFEKAKSSYEYAALVDFSKRNEMFNLVESDLYYASGKYFDALESFQTFFLRSSNKYKYLDRYILIQIKLNNLGEAYNFYKKYESVPSLKLSSSNRYAFYKAASKLLELLNKADEKEEVNAQLESIKPIYYKKEEKEAENKYLNLTYVMLEPFTIYDRNKNVLRKFMMLCLDNDIEYAYIYKENEQYHYAYPDKKQMFEKTYSIEDELSQSLKEILTYDEIKETPYFITKNLEFVEICSLVLPLKDEYHNYGALYISGKRKEPLFCVLRNLCFARLKEINVAKSISLLNNQINELLNSDLTGLLILNKENVTMVNDYAKKILESDSSVVTYAELGRITNIENCGYAFFDEQVESSIIITKELEDLKKAFEFNIVKNEGLIYSFLSDITETYFDNMSSIKYYNHDGLNFYNVNHLKKFILKNEASYTIIGLLINIVEASDSLEERNNKLNSLYKHLSQIYPSSTLYYLGENRFLIKADSVDKRTIENIYEKINSGMKQLFRLNSSLRENKFHAFASKALKNKTFSEVSEVIDYGFKECLKRDDFLLLDNEEKRYLALYKTYENEVVRLLKEGKINLIYCPILDENDKTIHYFYPKIIFPLGIDKEMFEKIISNNSLENRLDNLLIDKIISDVKDLDGIRVMIFVHRDSVLNPNFIKKTSLMIKDAKLTKRIVLNVPSVKLAEYEKSIDSMYNSKIRISKYIGSLDDMQNLDKYESFFLNSNDTTFINCAIKLNELSKKEIIIKNHFQNGSLTIRDTYKTYTANDLENLNRKI